MRAWRGAQPGHSSSGCAPLRLTSDEGRGATMILILTDSSDTHADDVERKLKERGADLVRSTLRVGEELVDLNRLSAVWYRRPEYPVAAAEIADGLVRDFVEEQCKTFVRDAWDALDGRWVPAPPAVVQRAQLKASQLKVA